MELAVILIRGTVNVQQPIKDTLTMLRLRKKHVCVIIPDTPTMRGMIRQVKDLITWGTIDAEGKQALATREQKDPNGKPFYRLSPPRGGFERKGIKVPFKLGGALGERGAEINDLIKKMV